MTSLATQMGALGLTLHAVDGSMPRVSTAQFNPFGSGQSRVRFKPSPASE